MVGKAQRQIKGRVTLAHALPEAAECWRDYIHNFDPVTSPVSDDL